MNDEISVFSGVKPTPIGTATWQETLERIKSDRYKEAVLKARSIVDLVEYREYKKKMPAVTFCGLFNGTRNRESVLSPTGFIIPDLDHLNDVEAVFDLLAKDENIWFAFRSPSGEGIKCGLRAENINSDDDIKVFYASVERYFKETYQITIDPACKDVSRLTFVSHDPALWVNPSPFHFDIQAWSVPVKDTQPLYDPSQYSNSTGKEKYARKVLESCCEEIRQSPPGQQHHTRLRMARLIGGFIQYISEDEVMAALEDAVVSSGAKMVKSAMKTIKDGVGYGKQQPLKIEDRERDIQYYCDVDSVSQQSQQSKQSQLSHANSSKVSESKQDSPKVSTGKQEVSTGENDDAHRSPINLENPDFGMDFETHAPAHVRAKDKEKNNYNTITPTPLPDPPQNLAAHIREWISSSSGSFSTEQLDREFCLTTRREKNNRAKCLSAFAKENLIKKDKKFKGKYHILDTGIDFFDLEAEEPDAFPIALPFNLHEYVKIPPKAIIVLAGASNAGKTAFILNTIKINLHQEYRLMYLMSEMGSGEYKNRIRLFKDPIEKWKKVKAASRSYDFDGAVQHHNKDGLTFVDYLEEIDGEYFKIASSIRDIYDSLGDGVAFVAIQKKTNSEFARGGEATIEKARLYLTLDYIATAEQSIVCALKITKVKHFLQKNLLNHEIHFRITKGCLITPLTDWAPSSKIDRKKLAAQYELERNDIGECDYVFQTDKGVAVVVKEKDAEKWKAAYQNIDVDWELSELSRKSHDKQFIKYKGYFFQISNILKKINDERGN